MAAVTNTGNTQTIRGHTTNLFDSSSVPYSNLDDDTGAPWEIHIKSVARDSASDWGTSTYSLPYGHAGAINFYRVETIGNHIHRLLKYYLGNRYHLSNIEAVTLNIALKSSPQTLQ